jgi:hypothetical protein
MAVKLGIYKLSYDATDPDKSFDLSHDGSLTSLYVGPHWYDEGRDGRAEGPDDDKLPAAFQRGSTMTVSSFFEYPAGAPVQQGQVKVRGDGPRDLDFPATNAIVNAEDRVITVAGHVASNPFINEIGFFDSFNINWEVSLDGGLSWLPAGTTKNRLYVTGASAQAAQESVVYIGSKAAQGLRPAELGELNPGGWMANKMVFEAIWSKFESNKVENAKGDPLRYWGPTAAKDWETTDVRWLRHFSVDGLLYDKDARCEAWALFFGKVLEVQGVTGVTQLAVAPKTVPHSDPNLNVLIKKGFRIDPDLQGQGGLPTQNEFASHRVIGFNDKIYDPSYGEEYDTAVEWEDESIVKYLSYWKNGDGTLFGRAEKDQEDGPANVGTEWN